MKTAAAVLLAGLLTSCGAASEPTATPAPAPALRPAASANPGFEFLYEASDPYIRSIVVDGQEVIQGKLTCLVNPLNLSRLVCESHA